MTPKAQRIAIAEACPNIRWHQLQWRWYSQALKAWIPCVGNDPLNDLNAMHEAEKVLPKNRLEIYASWLRDRKAAAESPAGLYHWHATAARRAEAFLRAIGRWEDTP